MSYIILPFECIHVHVCDYAFTHNAWLPACRGGMKFEPKWSLPLCDLSFSPSEENPEGKQQICLVKGRQRYPCLLFLCVSSSAGASDQ